MSKASGTVFVITCADPDFAPWPVKGTLRVDVGGRVARIPCGFVQPRVGTFTCPMCGEEAVCLYRALGAARLACRECLLFDPAARTLVPEPDVRIEAIEYRH